MERNPTPHATKPFVVYWNNIPSPYMVDRFNALAQRGSIDFEVWFNERTQPDRSWEVDESTWRFRYRYMHTTRFFGRVQHWPWPILGKRPDLIVCLHGEPAFIVGWAVAKLRGAKTVFRVLKTYDRWVPRHRIKEYVKRFLFRRVDGVETPGRDGKEFAMSYGTPEERVFYATHTVDLPRVTSAWSRFRLQREDIRSAIGLRGATFLYVGRLWWGKGVDVLLEAFALAQGATQAEQSLLLVGDGEEEARLRRACVEQGLRNVVFAGFQQKQDLPRYYAVSDVFVFPTLGDPYGLVVDEAMASSLPVISTTAAGEIRDRVEDGVNGYLVPPEDSAALASRMLDLTSDPSRRVDMGKISFEKVQERTPQKWACDFQHIVNTLCPGGGRR